MSNSVIMFVILPVLLVFSAIASGSETALFRLSHRERAELKRDVPSVGEAVSMLLADPRRLLLLILIINMIANVAYFVVSSILTARMETPLLGATVGVGSVLAIVLFGEILAKVLAGTLRRSFCIVFARPMAALLMIAKPLLVGVDRFALSPMIRLVRPGDGAPTLLGRQELRGLVESGRESGAIGETEWRLLEEVLELGELRVREAMVPRDRVIWIADDASPSQVLETAAANRSTTLLVCRGGLDGDLIGTLHVKQYLAEIMAQKEAAMPGRDRPDLRLFTRPLLVVPEQARLDVVFERMRAQGVTLAACVDERGAVVGMIGASDIVDELLAGMGEEAGDEKHQIQLVKLGAWSVPGSLSARDWAQAFGVDEDEIAHALPRAATVGGLVVDRLGKLASVGDEVQIGPAIVRVTAILGRRIDAVEVRFPESTAREGGGQQ